MRVPNGAWPAAARRAALRVGGVQRGPQLARHHHVGGQVGLECAFAEEAAAGPGLERGTQYWTGGVAHTHTAHTLALPDNWYHRYVLDWPRKAQDDQAQCAVSEIDSGATTYPLKTKPARQKRTLTTLTAARCHSQPTKVKISNLKTINYIKKGKK